MKTLIQEYKKAFLNGGIWITAFAVFSITETSHMGNANEP